MCLVVICEPPHGATTGDMMMRMTGELTADRNITADIMGNNIGNIMIVSEVLG
jgi:hypothetical protein